MIDCVKTAPLDSIREKGSTRSRYQRSLPNRRLTLYRKLKFDRVYVNSVMYSGVYVWVLCLV